MRVVHVVRQFSPMVGGLEDAVLNLVKVQRQRLGIDASVVTLDRVFGHPERLPATEMVQGVPVRRIGWHGSRRYPVAPAVLKAIRQADLVHVHAIDFFFDFLALTRPLHRKPLVVTTHGGFFHSEFASQLKRVWFDTATRASCLCYDRVIACSQSDADTFRAHAAGRLRLIENGIDAAKFAAAGSPSHRRTLLTIGRFARHKRVSLLFPILQALRARDPEWRLIVAGSDGEETRAGLETAAAAAGVGEAVRFVTGASNDALRDVMGEASYFISASAYEGFGIAAVEALSAGLLPILNDIAPFRRLVERIQIGLVVDAAAADDTAEKIFRLAGQQDQHYQRTREAAIQSVRGLDWNSVAASYAHEYAATIAQSEGAAVLGAV